MPMTIHTQHRTVERRPISTIADVMIPKPFSRPAFLTLEARADQCFAANAMTEFAALDH
jgi:hypothetical protein